MATDRDLSIPAALNVALVVGVVGAQLGLLALSTRLVGGPLLVVAIAYAAVFQTGYALLHEASHLKLHPSPRRNRWLGLLVGVPFGLSVTMFCITHWSHHLKNRSTEESFDQLAPGEPSASKTVAWYGMLLSLWYWVAPLTNVLFLVAPGRLERIARRVHIGDAVFDAPAEIRNRIRLELLVWFAAWCAAGALVGWRALALQALAAWWWSSSNYVEHAYAPLDIRRGAFNLRAPRWLSWLNLYRELDLAHHCWPQASWIHLPQLSHEMHGSWFAHWLRQWRGPVLAMGTPPPPVSELPSLELP